jgi:protein-S-isoprenylcysteine O-methyltransferase Ste14
MNAVKTILYMGGMHGFLTFYFPYQLASHDKSFTDFGLFRYSAFLFWSVGTWIIIQCSVDIIRRGRGTPSHLDPPKSLVINGWYRLVRNPIYLGALIVQVGYIVWFSSLLALLYAFLFFLAFQFLIVFVEEPLLRNTFGEAYEEYQKKVPRWVPKFK